MRKEYVSEQFLCTSVVPELGFKDKRTHRLRTIRKKRYGAACERSGLHIREKFLRGKLPNKKLRVPWWKKYVENIPGQSHSNATILA